YEDEETGLYYNRFRYYMPEEGIYTQRDPIGLAGGNPTVYGYVYNTNSQIDPWGLINFNDYTDERLLEKIWELAYRDKRFPGNSGGTHGVIHRIKEQVQGKMRPPHPGWDTHDNQIKSGLKNLRKALDEARKRGPKFISKVNGKMPNVNKVAALNPPKPTDTKVPRLCR
ncbi:MAG: RHS repeat-associated core domain-containing protein, partial [Defluviitaleaceae bacterium]|nr:RHS repeat-associated core domain-containing protein [Defluviitaleaceae bacterium]